MVRALLYGISFVSLVSGAVGMALLPRLAPTPHAFFVGGAILTAFICLSWVVLVGSARDWFRPRTGKALILAGIIGAMLGIRDQLWFDAIWSVLVVLVGIGLTFPVPGRPPVPSQTDEPDPGPVTAPLGRRREWQSTP